MNTVGIIAEYNPFHKGHTYQIAEIKRMTNAQNIVVVMSGDFVQRGMPAWTDKYTRTKMALSQGADFIFELPVVYATASAEGFAMGGVSLLHSLGFVDAICFGSECGDLVPLQKLADYLCEPPADFEVTLKRLLADGYSYPAARQEALSHDFGEELRAHPDLLLAPNNTLAIEYLKALKQCHSSLTPITILRKGSAYHNHALTDSLPSASAIRQAFQMADTITTYSRIPSYNDSDNDTTDVIAKEVYEKALLTIKDAVPASVYNLLSDAATFPVQPDHFSDLLYYRLMHLSEKDMEILDMTPELYHRIVNSRGSFTDYLSFIDTVKTKQYTYSRVSRVLLHLLLEIYCHDLIFPVPYARLLGFRKAKSSLLKEVTQFPVITKPADGITVLKAQDTDASQHIQSLYQKDITSADLYTRIQQKLCMEHSTQSLELQHGPVIV